MTGSQVEPPVLNEADRELLRSFGLTDAQRAEVWAAWLTSPEGVERVALAARALGRSEGRTGAGLLLAKLRRGDHLVEPEPASRRTTGWRFVRGTHSGTYLRDARGTDPLPAGYAASG